VQPVTKAVFPVRDTEKRRRRSSTVVRYSGSKTSIEEEEGERGVGVGGLLGRGMRSTQVEEGTGSQKK
jgi:hypothetical protein